MRAGQVDIEIAENVVDTDLPTSKNKIKVPGIDAEKAERTTTMEQTTLLEWKSHLGTKSKPMVWKPKMQHADMQKLLQRKYRCGKIN